MRIAFLDTSDVEVHLNGVSEGFHGHHRVLGGFNGKQVDEVGHDGGLRLVIDSVGSIEGFHDFHSNGCTEEVLWERVEVFKFFQLGGKLVDVGSKRVCIGHALLGGLRLAVLERGFGGKEACIPSSSEFLFKILLEFFNCLFLSSKFFIKLKHKIRFFLFLSCNLSQQRICIGGERVTNLNARVGWDKGLDC